MNVKGKNYRTIWMDGNDVQMIEQNLLPFQFSVFRSEDYLETARAISNMTVRGAGAIGAAAGFAMAQAFIRFGADGNELQRAKAEIESTRPTAQNLFYATNRVFKKGCSSVDGAILEAQAIAHEAVEACRRVGELGEPL